MNNNLLTQIRLDSILEFPNMSIRLKNCIKIAFDDPDFQIISIQDFLNAGASAKDYFIRKVLNMGLKTFNELNKIILDVSKIYSYGKNDVDKTSTSGIDNINFDYIKRLLIIHGHFTNNRDQLNALLMSLAEFVKTYECSRRLTDSIVQADKYKKLPFSTVEEYRKYGSGAIDSMLLIPTLDERTALELDDMINEIVSDKVTDVNENEFNSSTDEIIKFILFKNITVRLRNALNDTFSNSELPYDFFKDFLSFPITIVARKSLFLIKNIGAKSVEELENVLLENSVAINEIYLSYRNKDKEKRYLAVVGEFHNNPEVYILSKARKILSEKELTVLNNRYGIGSISKKTLEEIGNIIFVTRERVRQIEKNALRKLGGVFKNDGLDIFYDYYSKVFIELLYGSSLFISEKTIKKEIKLKYAWLKIYFDAAYDGYINFLNLNYLYDIKFEGWFLSEKVAEESSTVNLLAKTDLINLEQAVEQSQWPIRLNNLLELTNLPESVLVDKINYNKNYLLKSINNTQYVHVYNVPVKSAIKYILRKHKRAMTRYEIKNEYIGMFNKSISVGQVGSTLGGMDDALIVDRGIYNLYENMGVGNEVFESIREKTKEYLLTKQEYISSKIIIRNLRILYPQSHVLQSVNGYSLLGILQDGVGFDCRRGFMIGLSNDDFIGEFVDLETDIKKIMKKSKFPLSINEIIYDLSGRRELMAPSLQIFLDGNDVFSIEGKKSYGLSENADLTLNIDNESIDDSIISDWDI